MRTDSSALAVSDWVCRSGAPGTRQWMVMYVWISPINLYSWNVTVRPSLLKWPTWQHCQLLGLCSVGDRWTNECAALVKWCWLGKPRSTRRETCPSATLSAINIPDGLAWDRTLASLVRGRRVISICLDSLKRNWLVSDLQRRRRKAGCYLLSTDICHRFVLRLDTNLNATSDMLVSVVTGRSLACTT